MAIYANMNPPKRVTPDLVAPKISAADLDKILDAALPDDYGNTIATRIYQLVDREYASLFPKIKTDMSAVDVDDESFVHVGTFDTRSGVAYALVRANGDHELPVHAAVYFDGENLRACFPTHGNTFDAVTKSAFRGNTFQHVRTVEYVQDETPVSRTIRSRDEWLEFLNTTLAPNLAVEIRAFEDELTRRFIPQPALAVKPAVAALRRRRENY